MTINGPVQCKVGEEISLEVTVFNNLNHDLTVEVFLPDSDSYQFVMIEDEYIAHGGKRVEYFSGSYHVLVR